MQAAGISELQVLKDQLFFKTNLIFTILLMKDSQKKEWTDSEEHKTDTKRAILARIREAFTGKTELSQKAISLTSKSIHREDQLVR